MLKWYERQSKISTVGIHDTYSAQKAAKIKKELKPMALSKGGVNCAITKFPIQLVIVVSPNAKERPLIRCR